MILMQRCDSTLYDSPPPSYDGGVAPSAPPLDPNDTHNQKLFNISYDQVVLWWNALSDDQRQKMQAVRSQIALKHLKVLRKEYVAYYPHNCFPEKSVDDKEL